MQTHFATAERTTTEELHLEIDLVRNNPVVTKIMHSVGGLLAVLDENRQIVALNDTFLQILGVQDTESIFGLRPGEAVHCIHARKELGGCGTSQYCSTCGAVIAILSSLENGLPHEQTCSISTKVNGTAADLYFSVKSYPLNIKDKNFVLLFLQDITAAQKRAALERTFFHDVNNMLQMLVGASELLLTENSSPLSKTIHQASLRLQDEIAIQRCLSRDEADTYTPLWKTIFIEEIFGDLQQFFKIHPMCKTRLVHFSSYSDENIELKSDNSLLWRILHNMILNALEASADGEEVKVWFEKNGDFLTFKVWNAATIPEKTAHRVFERNFSTKEGYGRGIGTFSIKYFGEKILNGQVSFTTNKKDGTTFSFTTPISGA